MEKESVAFSGMKNDPFRKLYEKMNGSGLLRRGERFLIACSGGPDSVALVHLVKNNPDSDCRGSGIIYFDHQLRRASKKDVVFVRNLARRLGFAFYSGRGNVKGEARRTKTSIEEAARKMRYDFFKNAAKRFKIRKIALAHTLDDQAETVLMRILQGTGLRGLAGIRQSVVMDGVTFVRPLLETTKKELLEFLRAGKIPYRTDRSNRSEKFLRNRIRLKLLPMLRREFNPRISESLARLPRIAAEETSLLDLLESKAWRDAVGRAGPGGVEFNRSVFLELPAPLQFRVLGKALKKIHSSSGLSYEAWQRLRKGFSRRRNRWSLPKDIDLALTPKTIRLYKKHRPG